MNLNISEHYEYNQYKEKLNEIFDKLDEVIYISNTIDYKKITILLAEIVQNFDYFKHHKDKLAADAAKAEAAKAEAAKAAMVGGVGNDNEEEGVPEGVPEATSIPVEEPPPKPYSKIDFAESIKNIKEGEEYIKLVSYINTTKQRINTKGTKLMEKVNEFITAYLQTPEHNTMIYSDYIKQHSNLEFKLNDIISNIKKIEDGIQKESTEYAKIYVDLMSNNWCSIKYEQFKFLAICADGWYSFIKKPFVKNAHVIEKKDGDVITKDDYNDFVENKLYILYNKLHDGFLKEPKDTKGSTDENPKATPTEDFDAINVLFKKQFESINKKLAKANAKADEAEDAKDEADVENDDVNEAEVANKGKAKEGESTNDEEGDEETKTEAETTPLTTKEAEAKVAETETTPTAKEKKAEAKAETETTPLTTKEAETETTPLTTKEAETETTPLTTKVAETETTPLTTKVAETETTPLTTKVAETETTPTAKEKKAEAKIEKEAKALTEKAKANAAETEARLEAIKTATNRNVANAEAEARIIEARIESAKTLAEEKKASLASKAEENKALLEEKADNARKLVLQTTADAEAKMSSLIGNQTSQFKGLANSFNLLKGDVGAEAEAKKTKGFYANIIKNKNKLNPQNAFQEFTKI
jgi:hypothetical protein